MPRGVRKPIDYDEQLMKIDAQIIKHKNTITELQKSRDEILAQKRQQELSALYSAMEQAGKTPADLIEMLASP